MSASGRNAAGLVSPLIVIRETVLYTIYTKKNRIR